MAGRGAVGGDEEEAVPLLGKGQQAPVAEEQPGFFDALGPIASAALTLPVLVAH